MSIRTITDRRHGAVKVPVRVKMPKQTKIAISALVAVVVCLIPVAQAQASAMDHGIELDAGGGSFHEQRVVVPPDPEAPVCHRENGSWDAEGTCCDTTVTSAEHVVGAVRFTVGGTIRANFRSPVKDVRIVTGISTLPWGDPPRGEVSIDRIWYERKSENWRSTAPVFTITPDSRNGDWYIENQVATKDPDRNFVQVQSLVTFANGHTCIGYADSEIQ